MVGHDDDAMPSLAGRGSRAGRGSEASRASRWAGLQSDVAIVSAIAFFPELATSIVTTTEQLLATDASVVVVLSYYTQPSFAWYATFFAALRALEARGTTVYPSCAFKQFISSKAEYIRLLQSERLPMCPTEVLERSECVDGSGALSLARVHSASHVAQAAAHAERASHRSGPQSPSLPMPTAATAWPSGESGGRAGSEPTSELENADLQHHTSETSAARWAPSARQRCCSLSDCTHCSVMDASFHHRWAARPPRRARLPRRVLRLVPAPRRRRCRYRRSAWHEMSPCSKRQRVEESASVNAHGSEMGRRPEASRSPHSHPNPGGPLSALVAVGVHCATCGGSRGERLHGVPP